MLIPKQKPLKDVNKHLRPISLTPVLSKVAAEFVVAEHLRLQRCAMRVIFHLYDIATYYIKPTWRRSLDIGSLSQLSVLIPSLATQTINCMSSCHLVRIVNPI